MNTLLGRSSARRIFIYQFSNSLRREESILDFLNLFLMSEL